MRKYIIYLLSNLFLTFLPFAIWAKFVNYKELPDSARFQIRIQSFLLIHPEDQIPDSLFSPESEVPLAFIYDVNHQFDFIKKIKAYSSIHPLTLIITNDIITVPDCLISDIVVCQPTIIDTIIISNDSISHSSVDSCMGINELLLINLNSITDRILTDVFTIWEYSGKLPNFIVANSAGIDTAIHIIKEINATSKIYGEVLEGEQLLDNVYWENSPGVKTYGYFIFPLNNTAYTRLIPYKAGYRFSPDIIHQSISNKDDAKIFHGFKHEPDYGLTDHFTFNKKIRNISRGIDKSVISNEVEYVRDKSKGWVARFKYKSYIDAGLQSKGALKSTFSITAWIKPTQFSLNNSILGKGRNFVLKLHNGYLTFTMAGIKDYISENSVIPLNTWTHIAMVYSKFNNYIDFYINGKHTEQIDLIADYEGSDYSLIIGSNLWEEFFIGYIKEIKIWDRELSGDETKIQYQQFKNWMPEKIIWIGIIILTGICLILYFYLKKDKRIKKQIQPRISNTKFQSKGEQIICFGGLKIIDSGGNEINLKLSPKLKQLFTLILLYSLDDNNGISSRQMNEILWPGMNSAKTKNIRGTYIQNLKTALTPFKNINLVFENKTWRFDFKNEFYNEYLVVKQILLYKDPILIEKHLPVLIDILRKGRFLQGMEESWLDPSIERMDNRIIEFCLSCFSVLDVKKHATFIFDLSEIISINDPLNETALQKKIQLLVAQGKLSLAHNIYDNFIKLYKELYKEDYSVEFKELLNEKIS